MTRRSPHSPFTCISHSYDSSKTRGLLNFFLPRICNSEASSKFANVGELVKFRETFFQLYRHSYFYSLPSGLPQKNLHMQRKRLHAFGATAPILKSQKHREARSLVGHRIENLLVDLLSTTEFWACAYFLWAWESGRAWGEL